MPLYPLPLNMNVWGGSCCSHEAKWMFPQNHWTNASNLASLVLLFFNCNRLLQSGILDTFSWKHSWLTQQHASLFISKEREPATNSTHLIKVLTFIPIEPSMHHYGPEWPTPACLSPKWNQSLPSRKSEVWWFGENNHNVHHTPQITEANIISPVVDGDVPLRCVFKRTFCDTCIQVTASSSGTCGPTWMFLLKQGC